MQRLAWISDPHLNFVDLGQWDHLVSTIARLKVDALIVTGDISEADDVTWELRRIATECDKDVYFVLGNHDFYHGSIDAVRGVVRQACGQDKRLHYLTGETPVRLSEEWVLCGDDAWADTWLGNYDASPLQMNDFVLIRDFQQLDRRALRRALKREGARSAIRLASQLTTAAEIAKHILVVLHVPPFLESCWYEGRHTDDDWAPFFTCHAVGRALRNFCSSHHEHQILVLCGHTHSAGRSRMMDNLVVWTAAARYGHPEVADVLDLRQDIVSGPTNWSYQ